jgi:spore germination protein YaaH
MTHPQLRSTIDIELANTDFETPNHQDAAEEILQFYAEGVRTFVEMEDLGNWSRSLYQQVYKKYFRALTENGASSPETTPPLDQTERSGYRQGYRDGYSDAVEDLFDRIADRD